ncbi:MAG: sigma-70 family RNA polymerase sigma factor [Ruminococcaceae bacterium]|nr:sigma-70 family RNA polymerase sigma factor [Oscillospiraceae bacterium]
MEDGKIIELYFDRSESAIAETERKYGRYCRAIAGRILSNDADAEECVSDTWLRAWNAMPPNRPERLGAYLGRITRNLALDRLRADKGAVQEELGECLSAGDPTAAMVDRVVLTEALNRFLAGLPAKRRKLFLRRYWYFSTVEELARDFGMSQSNVKMTLLRLRRELKEQLNQEGIEP